jgi:hypothetical protein
MNTNSTQTGYTPIETMIQTNENEFTIDQLISVEVPTTNQPLPTIPLNPMNMIPSQTPSLQNLQQQQQNNNNNNHLQNRHQQQNQHREERQRQLEEQRRIRQEQHQQRQQQQQSRRQRRQQRFEQWLERASQRRMERNRRERELEEHFAYLARRSPYHDEWMEEALAERQLDQYNFESLSTQERREIRDQQYLDEIQGYIAPRVSGLPSGDLERYVQFLEDEYQRNLQEQALQIENMHKNEYEEECIRSQEPLTEKEEWEGIAFRLQQIR